MNESIAVIPKNSLDEIRVSLSNFHGFDLLDIRTYSERRDSKERVPTPKGISLKVSQIDELIDAIRQARAVAVERGLLKAADAA